MRIVLLFICLVCLSFPRLSAQVDGDTLVPTYTKAKFSTLMPHFTGGENALREYINAHLVYPDTALKMKAEGKVYLSFVVTKKGELRDIKVKSGARGPLGNYFNQEALRIMRTMPSWEPGRKDNVPVNMRLEMPLNFHL